MNSTIPQLTLFPLYPGGPLVRYKSGSLNATSSFYTNANGFTPGYGVNVRPTGINDDVFSLNNVYGVSRGSNGASLNGPIGFDATAAGGLRQVAVPAVAPVIPSLYEALVRLRARTEGDLTDLLNQTSPFNINRLGLTVTPDGAGNVDSVTINPALKNLNPALSPLDSSFAWPDRTQITTGAVFNRTLDSGLGGSLQRLSGVAGQNPLTAGIPNVSPQGLQGVDLLSSLLQQSPDFGLDAGDFSPILEQRLNQLQPPAVSIAVTGFEATLQPEQARQVAVVQAGLDVQPGEQFRANIAGLAGAANRNDSYAAGLRPGQMDGRMPLAPSMPNAAAGLQQSAAGMAQDGFNLGSTLTGDKRGSGGYVPFQMQSQTQSGFSGGSNPFMLPDPQQQRRRMTPFAA